MQKESVCTFSIENKLCFLYDKKSGYEQFPITKGKREVHYEIKRIDKLQPDNGPVSR